VWTAAAIGWSIRGLMEKHMSKTSDSSSLGHIMLKRHLTEEELNAVAGGTDMSYSLVAGACHGAVEAAAPGTWIPPGWPAGVSVLK
jgi:hypothetical protein